MNDVIKNYAIKFTNDEPEGPLNFAQLFAFSDFKSQVDCKEFIKLKNGKLSNGFVA